MPKYVEKRTRASGEIYWAFNPTKAVRNALHESYQQFESRSEAVKYAKEIELRFADHRRGIQREARVSQDTVFGLISFYKSTTEWQKLKDNSKRFYELMIRTASDTSIQNSHLTFAELQSNNVNSTQADKLFQSIEKAVSRHRALHTIKIMRKIWFVGLRHGKISTNPFQNMRLKGLEDRKVLWEPEQVQKVIQTADKMGISSIGTLVLMCYDLCQRPGDMRQLVWDQYSKGVFEFEQEKTNTIVSVPASPRLQERLDAHKTDPDGPIIVCETTGKAYDRNLYVKYFARVRRAAGLPKELQIRDLRRTGATEMAEAGCTEDELRSVTGHQSRDVLSIYVRPTTKLAAAGINKRFS